jgi:succinate dehydrogenase / fumarate reductase cytochrome b subunit
MQSDNRPLSPHLQVYKPQWTSFGSIMHRATGIALTFGSLLAVYWLIAIASGPEAYATAQAFFGNFLVQIVLFGFTLAFVYKTLSGFRHLVWDTGHGLTISQVEKSAKLIVGLTVVLSVVLWLLALL